MRSSDIDGTQAHKKWIVELYRNGRGTWENSDKLNCKNDSKRRTISVCQPICRAVLILLWNNNWLKIMLFDCERQWLVSCEILYEQSLWIWIVVIHGDGIAIPVTDDESLWLTYHQTSNISRTLVRNKIGDHSDVVGASPIGAAPTSPSVST